MAYLLSLLPLLACPLMMALMIWLMRGNHDQMARRADEAQAEPPSEPAGVARTNAVGRLHICLNWKVVAALVTVGLGIWVAAPSLIWTALPMLILLACPLSMLFMMRGMSEAECTVQPQQERQPQNLTHPHHAYLASRDTRHAATARKIAKFESPNEAAEDEAELVAPVSQ